MLLPDDRRAIADRLLRPAAELIADQHWGLSNWQAQHNVALAVAGRLLEDPGLVSNAFYDEEGGFFTHFAQGAPDGFWSEGTWGYHLIALSSLLYLAELGQRAGLNTYSHPTLRAMFATSWR